MGSTLHEGNVMPDGMAEKVIGGNPGSSDSVLRLGLERSVFLPCLRFTEQHPRNAEAMSKNSSAADVLIVVDVYKNNERV